MRRGFPFAAPNWDRPGALLLDPLFLVLVLVTALNDHWGKALWPGPVTGKVSDLAGLGFFPIALVGVGELLAVPLGTSARARVKAVAAAALMTGAVFVAIKWSATASAWYQTTVQSLWQSFGVTIVVHNVVDPSDLLALPALALPIGMTLRRRLTVQQNPARAQLSE